MEVMIAIIVVWPGSGLTQANAKLASPKSLFLHLSENSACQWQYSATAVLERRMKKWFQGEGNWSFIWVKLTYFLKHGISSPPSILVSIRGIFNSYFGIGTSSMKKS